MKLYKSILFTLMFSFVYLNTNAQDVALDFDPTQVGGNFLTTFSSMAEVGGTPFFNDYWVAAELILNNGATFSAQRAKYDAYNDNLIIVHEADTLIISNQIVRSFILELPDQSPVKFQNRVGVVQGEFDAANYLKVHYEGNAALYSRFQKTIRTSGAARSSYDTGPTGGTFVDREEFYFRNLEGEFETVRLRQRNVLRLFDNHSNDVRDYARSNDLDFRDPADVAKMIAKYESLALGL